LGNNINSNNFLEVLIAGVKLTPRVKYVSKYKGNRRLNIEWGQIDPTATGGLIVFTPFSVFCFVFKYDVFKIDV